MHELSIAQALVEVVKPHLPASSTLRSVSLRVGPMRGIEPQALRWAWKAATAGSDLDGSGLDLEMLPWTLRCPACSRQWTSTELFAACACGYDRPNPSGGDELEVVSLEVDER